MENSFKKEVDQAKADIRSIVEEMKLAEIAILSSAKNIREGFSGIAKMSTPDGLNKVMKDLNDTMTKLNSNLEKQTTNTDKLVKKKREIASLTAAEKVDSAALVRDAKLQATATSKLVGAYDNLAAKRKISARNLRNLIASEKASTNEIKKAKKELDGYTAKLNKANKATSNFSKNSLGGMVRGFKNLIGAFGLVGGATLFASMGREVFRLTKEIESLNFALKTVTKTQEKFTRVQLFLEDISNRYGASLITTTQRYTKFLAAAEQSNVSLAKTEQIFESVTKASGVLGLKTDELTGVYLALEQMLSKGKVTTEELRRQLGERLPGAFGIMAKALKVTVPELDKLLRKGKILSAEALPKFAVALEKAYGIESIRTVDTLVAAQNRLTNSWLLLVQSIEGGEGKISSVFKGVLNFVSKAVGVLNEFNKTFEDSLNKGSYSGTKVAIEAIADESERLNSSIKEAADSLIPRYSNILEGWKKKLGELNKEQSGSVLENALNVVTGKFSENENAIKRAGNQIGLYEKALESLKQASSTGILPTDEPEKNNPEPEKNTPTKKVKISSKKGSIGFLEERIAAFEKERKSLAVNTDLYRGYTLAIEQLKETLSDVSGGFEFDTLKGGKVETKTIGSAGNSELELFKVTQDAKIKALQDFKSQYEGINDEILENQEKKSKKEAAVAKVKFDDIKAAVTEVTDTFSEMFDIDIDKFDFLFDGIKNTVSDWASASKEAISVVLDATTNKYEIELQEAQRTRDLILQNDLATEKQKRLAKEKFDKEERAIKTKKAKEDRKNNLIKIAVDTAVGVVSALANPGGAAGIVLAGVVGALGIAQGVAVASQPLPKFAEGHLSGTYSGKALINDANRSSYQEVVERSGGQVEIYKNRNEVIDMKKGDKVHKSPDSFLSYHNIDRDVLNMSIRAQQETLSNNREKDAIVGKIDELKGEFVKTSERMERLAKRPINNHNHITISRDYDNYNT